MNSYRQILLALFSCCLGFSFSGNLAIAAPVPERILALDGKIAEDSSRINMSWAKATGTKIGRVGIQRRTLGQSGTASWQNIASTRSFTQVYLDKDLQSGIAYEYRVSRPAKEQTETGYWVAGRNLPAEEKRGVALVVVDETIAQEMTLYLDRFMLDLIGDGWQVIRHDVPRGDESKKNAVANLKAARKLRAEIKRHYYANPSAPHALILIGHIPIVKSGLSRPDGHTPRPQETDLFYADMNGIWRNNGHGTLRHSVLPSDHIEMQVGRIDFSNMDGTIGDEIFLLKRYFDKNHHWRHGRLGDLRQAYGGNSYLSVESNALLNIVGPGGFVKGGHHDAGTQQPWLFGVDFGSWKYSDYTTAKPIKTVFSINFGSAKLNFSKRNNAMTAMLAQQWYGLATGWGSRPAWQLHHMALGKSIGYSHLRTVNNGTSTYGGPETLEYTTTGDYSWLNPIWVNLLGDPTLHPFPLQSVINLRADMRDESVHLNWSKADTETKMQYRVYRALNRFGPYLPLNPLELLTGHQYVDRNPVAGARYMVRAHALKKVYAGSFNTFSQGAFAVIGHAPAKATDQLISTPMGHPVTVSLIATNPDSGNQLTTAFVNVPKGGQLIESAGVRTFIPDAGFSGQVNIPYTLFDGVASADGLIRINVVKP